MARAETHDQCAGRWVVRALASLCAASGVTFLFGCGTSAEVNRLLQESETRINAEALQSIQVQSGAVPASQRQARCAAQIDVKVDLQSLDFSSLRCTDASLPVMETFRMSPEQTRGLKKALGSLAVRRFVEGSLTICPVRSEAGSETDRIEVVHVGGKKEVYVSLAALQAARSAESKRERGAETRTGVEQGSRGCPMAEPVHGVFIDKEAQGLVTALHLD